MSDTPPFHEDFFERVVDVKWESEPEVYWMIGSGALNIVNGMPYGDTKAWMWTSDNGKKWKGQNLGIRPVQKGFGVLYHGCWMREGLKEGAPPVWVMGGGTSRLVATSAVGSSTDGKTFGNMHSMDETHVVDYVGQGSGGIFLYSMQTFNGHQDYFSSTDGVTWSPDNYHGGDTSGSFMVQPTAEHEKIATGFDTIDPSPIPNRSIIRVLTQAKDLELPGETKAAFHEVALQAAVTPQNSPGLFATGAETKADKMVFNKCGTFSTGLVRTGPFKGKRLGVAITPYHYFPTGGDHGDNTCAVYDMKKGTQLRNNSKDGLYVHGVTRSINVGYGHYTFVLVGSTGGDSKGTKSSIAWSTTGVIWKVVELGRHDSINVIAVGPRPKTENKTKDPIEEPPPPPPQAPTGPKPHPTPPPSTEVS